MENLLIAHCSPTLASLKTANLFTVAYNTAQELENEIQKLDELLSAKGVHVTMLRRSSQKALVYVYRESKLAEDLQKESVRCFLCVHGYQYTTVQEAVEHLKTRIQSLDSFPHEIGLFLSYPFDDVQAFIHHKGQNCKACGYWKVYGNEQEALRLFAKFKKCTAVYLRHWRNGTSVIQLTVAA
ncbi:MAG: DUF3793 family protein [Clostridiales bacterium]|nr:DUF3793 family protein [Clostridiales bacterium]